MRKQPGIALRRAGLIAITLGIVFAPWVAGATDSLGTSQCGSGGAASWMNFQTAAPVLSCERRTGSIPVEEQVAQSVLCCCVGFDGNQCCAQAASCGASPPGCLCRPN